MYDSQRKLSLLTTNDAYSINMCWINGWKNWFRAPILSPELGGPLIDWYLSKWWEEKICPMSDQSYLRYNFMRRMRRNAVSCKKLPFCVPHRGPATGVIFHRICRLLFTCNGKLSVLLGPGVGQVWKNYSEKTNFETFLCSRSSL